METRSLRREIREDLPESAFSRQPLRVVSFGLTTAAIAVLTVCAWRAALSTWQLVLVSVVLGQCYSTLALLAHDVLHGQIVRSRRAQLLLGSIGFGPFLISAHLWNFWHNQIHHGNTNRGDRDPDHFGTIRRFRKSPAHAALVRLAPGSGSWSSYLFFFYWFSFHGQMILWFQTRGYLFRDFDRRRSVFETLGFVAAWLLLASVVGMKTFVFVGILPMMMANATVMSYIATNHMLRPLVDSDDPLDNTLSLRTHWLVDALHCRFSHHVEHHLFPAMSSAKLPLVRSWLTQAEPERFIVAPHLRALRALYATPKVYVSDTEVGRPWLDGGQPVDLIAVGRDLSARPQAESH